MERIQSNNNIIKIIDQTLFPLLMFCTFLPTLYLSGFLFYFTSLVNLLLWIYLNYTILNRKINWQCMTLIFLIILIVQFLSWYHFYMILLSSVVIASPLIIWISRKKLRKKYAEADGIFTLSYFVFIPLSMLILSQIILILVDKYIDKLPISDVYFITLFITFFMVGTVVYAVSILFKIYQFVMKYKHTRFKLPLAFTGIISFLIIPDILISFTVYDLYFSLFKDAKFNYFDQYYYSFTIHFHTPITEIGEKMQCLFKQSILGQVIHMIHALTTQIVDITVLASIARIIIKK